MAHLRVIVILLASAYASLGQAQVQELPILENIGGRVEAMALSGDVLVYGQGVALRTLDVSDPGNAVPLGKIILPGPVTRIAVQGSYAYAVAAGRGLRIVNLMDPRNPVEVASVAGLSSVGGVAVQGDYVYFFGPGEIATIDISIPSEPVQVGSIQAIGGDRLSISGSRLYSAGSGVFGIYDISQPSSLVLRGSATIDTQPTLGMEVSAQFAFVANGDEGLVIIDLADEENPAVAGTFAVPASNAVAIHVNGSTAFVSFGALGVYALNVSDPNDPIVLEVFTPEPLVDRTTSLTGMDDRLFVGTFEGSHVYSVDASDPSNLSVTWNATGAEGTFRGVIAQAGHVFASSGAGLIVYSLQNSAALQEVGRVPLNGGNTAVLTGNIAFSTSGDGLKIIDVNDPTNPTVLATAPGMNGRSLLIHGSYLYLADGISGVHIVDINIPTNPVLITTHDTLGEAYGLHLRDNYLYIADGASGLRILEVSNPAAPQEVGFNVTVGFLQDVFVEGDFAFVGGEAGPGFTTLRVVDVSDKSAPVEVSQLTLNQGTVDIHVHDKTLYILTGDAMFSAIDVSDPMNPVEVATNRQTGNANQMSIGDKAYIASDSDGLFVIPIPPPAPSVAPLPRFINADTLTATGTAVAGSFVTVGGGALPVFQQLSEGVDTFSIEIPLKQEAVNILSITTMNEFGLVSLPAIRGVVEGAVYPSTLETVTSLAIAPDPAGPVAVDASLSFAATATFSDSSTADVTQFIELADFLTNSANQWSVTNGELITSGGLYVNNQPGSAQVQATVTGVASNLVTVGDAK